MTAARHAMDKTRRPLPSKAVDTDGVNDGMAADASPFAAGSAHGSSPLFNWPAICLRYGSACSKNCSKPLHR